MTIGFTVQLSALDSSDMPRVRTWRNDHRIWRWCRQDDLISDVAQENWFQRQSSDPTIRMYRIVASLEDISRTVGVCGLTSLDFQHSRAEFSLYIDPNLHGRGYGSTAIRILLDHGFMNLGLNQIWGETFEDNPAIKIFEAIGMKHDGTRRQFYFKEGRRIDAKLYSILRDEWSKSLSSVS